MTDGVQLDLGITPTYDSIGTMVEQVQLAEKLGFNYASLGESNGWSAVPILTMLAERTSEIGIGNDVFSPYSRSPALLAQTALTLQEASGGRYRLGLGTSSPPLVERWHGREFDRPLRRVRETIEIVREIYTGHRVHFEGEIFDIGGQRYERTVPEEVPPIDISALGPKTVELTGRFADGWIPQMFTIDGFEDRLDDLRNGAELGGRTVSDVRVTPIVRCFAHEDRDYARQTARQMLSFLVGTYGPYYANSIAEQGYEDVVDDVRSAWASGNTEAGAEAVPPSLVDKLFAAGTPEEVRDFVERYAAIDGVSAVRVGFVIGTSAAEQKETLEAVSPLI